MSTNPFRRRRELQWQYDERARSAVRDAQLRENSPTWRSTPEWFSAAATWVLAVATICLFLATGAIVWATLRQERATFESNLYARQIEAFAEAANKFNLIADESAQRLIDADVANAARGDEQKLDDLVKRVATLDSDIESLRQSPAVFVLPNEYAYLYASIYSDFLDVRRELSAALAFIAQGKKLEAVMGTSHPFATANTRRNAAYDNMVVFVRCGAFQLRSGHYLTAIGDCPPAVKAASDIYWPYVYERR